MAREFDGVDDRIVYSHVSAFDNRGSLAISTWYYPMSYGGSPYPKAIEQENASLDGWSVATRDNLVDAINTGFRTNADPVPTFNTSQVFTADTWHHLYVVYDGSQGVNADRVRVWDDGVAVGGTHIGTHPTSMDANAAAFQLGNSPETAAAFWHGRLAEIGIWLDADTSRIANLVAGQAPSFFPTNLHVYLDLAAGRGDTADNQGNAGAPTITGTTLVAHPPGITYPGTELLWLPRQQVVRAQARWQAVPSGMTPSDFPE